MPHLVGETIMLREYRQEDIPEMRKWVNDPQTIRYLSPIFWPPQTMTDTEEFMSRMLQSSHMACNFVVADKRDQSYVGQLDMFTINWKQRWGELGFVIGKKEWRNKGVGTEALGLMLGYAFQTLGLERVQLEVYMDNKAALRCYEKAGFVLEGVKRHAIFLEGRFADVGMMSVLAGEWREKHGPQNANIG